MKEKQVILLVDDVPQNNELLEAFLLPQGYEFIMANSGEEALEEIKKGRIDLILLDVTLPGISGFEVIQRIRQDPVHRLLPIILVTALHDRQDRITGIEAGCDGFITKPVDMI
ncbi:MAG: hypothetical protein A2Y38_23015 [Spirochaetes bacterium GWB1_59_5]|nr:MAG: hypothetical protein A2Y38_23015 [Spirochaetes bacterium GWB1_59_5]